MILETRVALVAGGGGHIGGAVSRFLAQKGASVAVADINENAACAVADAIRSAGGNSLGIYVDVTRKADVAAAVHRVEETFGSIDILVNCAGIYPRSRVAEMHEEEWDEVLDVNLKGAFLMCQVVIPEMQRKGRGKIVSIASGVGLKGAAGGAHYAASKGGLIAFTRSLARELGPYGVTVNTIAPALVGTEKVRTEMAIEEIEVTRSRIPMGRITTLQDVANTILFLVSDDSAYITGQTICVNGGDVML